MPTLITRRELYFLKAECDKRDMEEIKYPEEVRVDAVEAQWGRSVLEVAFGYRKAQVDLNKLRSDILDAMIKGRVYGHFV